MPSVLKDWVMELTLAEQGTLLTAVRGPDNIRKDHPVKTYVRVYRRAILNNAKPLDELSAPGTAGFMAYRPFLLASEILGLAGLLGQFYRVPGALLSFWESQVDDVPHHWLMHFAHAAQIVGAYYPVEESDDARSFWQEVYLAIVKSFHMEPERMAVFKHRLRDRGCH